MNALKTAFKVNWIIYNSSDLFTLSWTSYKIDWFYHSSQQALITVSYQSMQIPSHLFHYFFVVKIFKKKKPFSPSNSLPSLAEKKSHFHISSNNQSKINQKMFCRLTSFHREKNPSFKFIVLTENELSRLFNAAKH